MPAPTSLNEAEPDFKGVEASFQILQFAFVGLLLVPWELSPLVRLVPFAWPHRLLKLVTVRGERLLTMPWPEVLGAVLVSLACFAFGWAAFRSCLAVVRRLARLGHY